MSFVDSFVITNAEDLSDIDFACVIDKSSLDHITPLDFKYDKDFKTLTFKQKKD
jgi:hypothetical protein